MRKITKVKISNVARVFDIPEEMTVNEETVRASLAPNFPYINNCDVTVSTEINGDTEITWYSFEERLSTKG